MRVLRVVVSVVTVLVIAVFATYFVALRQYVIAFTGGAQPIPSTILSSPIGAWPEPAPQWPAPHVARMSYSAFDATTYLVRAQWTPTGFVASQTGLDVSRFWHEIKVGVPFRCARQWIRQENWFVPVPAGHIVAPPYDDGVPILGVRFPWRPIWPGLIANVVLIAVALLILNWVLERFFRWLAPIQRIRISQGLCGVCSYDRSGLAGNVACPECGAADAMTRVAVPLKLKA